MLDFLRLVEDKTPAGFGRIQYIEQPTARDLEANQHNVMHEAARIRPVVIDESLVDLASLKLARTPRSSHSINYLVKSLGKVLEEVPEQAVKELVAGVTEDPSDLSAAVYKNECRRYRYRLLK